MEDKLLNRIINQHMRNFIVTKNTIKHKTNTNDHITNITTASISREASDLLLKKENLNITQVTQNKKSQLNKPKHSSRSTDKIDYKRENKSSDKFVKKTNKIDLNKLSDATNKNKKNSTVVMNKQADTNKLKSFLSTNKKIFNSKLSAKDLSVSNKTDTTGIDRRDLTNCTNKTLSFERSPEKSINFMIEGGVTELNLNFQKAQHHKINDRNSLSIPPNLNRVNKNCCEYAKKNKYYSKCKCSTKIEEKDKIISSLNTRITDLQIKLRRMETLIKYSKSVDITQNALTEFIELPRKQSKDRKSKLSLSFLNTEGNINKNKKDFKTRVVSHPEYKNYNVNTTHSTLKNIMENNPTTRVIRSKDTKLKKYSLNLSGYNFKMLKPLIATNDKTAGKNSHNEGERSLKHKLHYSNDSKQRSIPEFHTTPINSKQNSNGIKSKKKLTGNEITLDNIDANKSFECLDFSFHQEDNPEADIKNQLKMIKTRTKAIMDKLSMANKKLISRVNSISELNIN